MHRVSTVVLAVGCFLGGYAVAGQRANASADDVQVRRLPHYVNQGDRVTMTFAAGSLATGMVDLDCRINGLSGLWVRCGSANDSLGSDREQLWYDLTRVVVVKKAER